MALLPAFVDITRLLRRHQAERRYRWRLRCRITVERTPSRAAIIDPPRQPESDRGNRGDHSSADRSRYEFERVAHLPVAGGAWAFAENASSTEKINRKLKLDIDER